MSNHAYLSHHGIKGQKWGVRRFQNEDGSYTSAGRQRYGVEGAGKRATDLYKSTNKKAKESILSGRQTRKIQKLQQKSVEKAGRLAKQHEELAKSNQKQADDMKKEGLSYLDKLTGKKSDSAFEREYGVSKKEFFDYEFHDRSEDAKMHRDFAKKWLNVHDELTKMDVSSFKSASEAKKEIKRIQRRNN